MFLSIALGTQTISLIVSRMSIGFTFFMCASATFSPGGNLDFSEIEAMFVITGNDRSGVRGEKERSGTASLHIKLGED